MDEIVNYYYKLLMMATTRVMYEVLNYAYRSHQIRCSIRGICCLGLVHVDFEVGNGRRVPYVKMTSKKLNYQTSGGAGTSRRFR